MPKPPGPPIAPRGYRWLSRNEPVQASDWCRDTNGQWFQLGPKNFGVAFMAYLYIRCKPRKQRNRKPLNKPSHS